MPHTPGPWHTDGAEIYAAYGIWVGETLDMASPDQGQANATLAAAAPDLLAALLVVVELLEEHDGVAHLAAEEKADMLGAVRDAIAKAEGRNQ